MTVTLDEIRQLIGFQLGHPSVGENDRIVEDLGAESFDVLNIITALEERYRIAFGDDEVPGITTVTDLFRIVQGKLGV